MRAAFDNVDLNDYARLYTASSPAPSEAFRMLLRFVAQSCDLRKLNLEVNAGSAAWSLFEDKGAGAYGGDEVDQDWRFVYEFYMDIGKALVQVFKGQELSSIKAETSIREGMGVWLAGQLSGGEAVVS